MVNAGSSSLKVAVFDDRLREVMAGRVTEIGSYGARVEAGPLVGVRPVADHAAALALILEAMEEAGLPVASLTAAAHRVVHGGASLVASCRVTEAVVAEVEACVPLAPLHNPANLTAIRALAGLVPELPQYASFDTAFHATNPDVARRYALPAEAEALGLRRYGFHGISYASIVRKVQEIGSDAVPERLLAFHLGNGASACAIVNGRSVATTMGYSPLDGLTMGTRSGGIDANAVLRLVEENGLERTKAILNHESGLLGLSGGKSDMRKLMLDASAESAFAVEHFCYWTLRHAGSLIAALEGLDAIAFTGGIGENAVGVRARILRGLEWAGVRINPDFNHRSGPRLHADSSKVAVWVIPAEEERMIAMDAQALLEAV